MIFIWERLNVTDAPRAFCDILVHETKTRFAYELNSYIYQVNLLLIDNINYFLFKLNY